MQFGHIIPLVPSSFALRYISIMLSLYLCYASVIPPLYLRFVNGGRSSSLRRMIEERTKEQRRRKCYINSTLTLSHILVKNIPHRKSTTINPKSKFFR